MNVRTFTRDGPRSLGHYHWGVISDSGQEPSPATPPRSLREEQKDLTRQRLITAALEVFSQNGYMDATIEEVTDAAGVSRATFYLHFRGKLSVVQAVIASLSDESAAIYESLAALPAPTFAQLRTWMEDTITFWERNLREVDVVQQALATDPDFTASYLDALDRSVEVMTAPLVAGGRMEGTEAQLRGRILILQLDRLCFFWIVRGLPMGMDRARMIDILTDVWWTTMYASDDPLVS